MDTFCAEPFDVGVMDCHIAGSDGFLLKPFKQDQIGVLLDLFQAA